MSDPLRYGTSPDDVFEALLEDRHLAQHRAAKGTQLMPVACRECRALRVEWVVGRRFPGDPQPMFARAHRLSQAAQ